MFKHMLVSGLLCTFLSADSFDIFLQKAINNSPYLKSQELTIQQTKQHGDILSRYENPSLEIELASFNPDSGSSDNGYSVNYTQPIRLWDVADDKKALANANIKNANISYKQKKAMFIRDISLLYTFYSNNRMLLNLVDEEVNIAKKIYDISLEKFQNGRISKGIKLQSKLDYEISKNSKKVLKLTFLNSYYSLLREAGINEEINLDTSHIFELNTKLKNDDNLNIKLLESKYTQAIKETKVNSHALEWIDVYAGLENESDQDTIRVGVSIPLTIFNKKSQEKTISTLEASRMKFLIKNEKNTLNMELNRLSKERKALLNLQQSNKKILEMELELLAIYEDGYRIANINLLQLQDIKNKVIKTKRELIQIHTTLNQNSVKTNYQKGNYNE